MADVERLRTDLDEGSPSGVPAQLTGGPAFAADLAGVFAGADTRLLLVTARVVALLLSSPTEALCSWSCHCWWRAPPSRSRCPWPGSC